MEPQKLSRTFLLLTAPLPVAAFALFRLCGNDRALLLLSLLLTVMVWGIALMAAALRRSLRITLYSYANIGLIGGILFVSVLAAVTLRFLLTLPRLESLSVSELFRWLIRFPRRFSYYAVFVLTALSAALAVSNAALIRHEGFCLNNALSLLVAGFYLGGTAVVYYLSDWLERSALAKGSAEFLLLHTVVSLFLLVMLCYFECILVGTAVMGYLAARQHPAHDKDYIIILGCSIDKRGGLLPLLKGRVNRAVRFAWEQEIATGKPVKYVPSGGQGSNEIMSEGSAMELYLLTHGAEDYEVFPEKRSVSTYENFLFSKEIIDSLQPGARVAFATTNYHMLRSGILARKAGLDAEGIAGDTKWYFWPNGFIREFFAILTLNVPCHVAVGCAAAVLSLLLGCIGWFGGLI